MIMHGEQYLEVLAAVAAMQVHVDQLDHKELLDQLAQLDIMDQQAQLDHKELLDQLVQLDIMDQQAQPGQLEIMFRR